MLHFDPTGPTPTRPLLGWLWPPNHFEHVWCRLITFGNHFTRFRPHMIKANLTLAGLALVWRDLSTLKPYCVSLGSPCGIVSGQFLHSFRDLEQQKHNPKTARSIETVGTTGSMGEVRSVRILDRMRMLDQRRLLDQKGVFDLWGIFGQHEVID